MSHGICVRYDSSPPGFEMDALVERPPLGDTGDTRDTPDTTHRATRSTAPEIAPTAPEVVDPATICRFEADFLPQSPDFKRTNSL